VTSSDGQTVFPYTITTISNKGGGLDREVSSSCAEGEVAMRSEGQDQDFKVDG
jgi:hypothetical protein